ncbi:hypothetical protein [Antiquaquibacter soli]|uniref:ATP/GTP-binding protein n=1 Tax=Antiquaquibacter soli TaxID=3064523 RepID=A0ABT9BPG4_9MICO|nr:hypothetical protein [Protaetiibacter sp. WY-16]MDO7882474.1 hypothetical protein [Protaetiibacter sp. WY-16]
MPRSNRPRGRRDRDEVPELDLARALQGRLHTESKRDGLWNVQPLTAASAVKVYTCPGCGLEIEPGLAHLVAWRADGLFGEADDLAARRHWHVHCWKIRT